MPVEDRNKGQFWQPAFITRIPKIAGSTLSVDGFKDFGTIHEKADLPDLFNAVGNNYDTGGESGTQFRLPAESDWLDTNVIYTQHAISGISSDPQTVVLGTFPAGFILRVHVYVKTLFSGAGSPALEIGPSGDPDLILPAGQIDIGQTGGFTHNVLEEFGAATELIATLSSADQGSGEATIIIEFTGDTGKTVPVIRF